MLEESYFFSFRGILFPKLLIPHLPLKVWNSSPLPTKPFLLTSPWSVDNTLTIWLWGGGEEGGGEWGEGRGWCWVWGLKQEFTRPKVTNCSPVNSLILCVENTIIICSYLNTFLGYPSSPLFAPLKMGVNERERLLSGHYRGQTPRN